MVLVPDPRLDVSYHKEADQVLSSLLDFKPSEWGLPPFEDLVNWTIRTDLISFRFIYDHDFKLIDNMFIILILQELLNLFDLC